MMEVARLLSGRALPLTVRFVAFANEEPPYFNTKLGMGSVEYAKGLSDSAEKVRAMLSVETVGLYSDSPNSQHYPAVVGLLYPDRGNFIAFVGNLGSSRLVRGALGVFREVATLPSEGAVLPALVPGVSWSDHRSFWDIGVSALMVTDTAPFRDRHYHLPSDTAERLDYERMARLVTGLSQVVTSLASDS
jgi:Zn-dependent M28 family amino/carboxypeptidase